jgi:hypothetical protein
VYEQGIAAADLRARASAFWESTRHDPDDRSRRSLVVSPMSRRRALRGRTPGLRRLRARAIQANLTTFVATAYVRGSGRRSRLCGRRAARACLGRCACISLVLQTMRPWRAASLTVVPPRLRRHRWLRITSGTWRRSCSSRGRRSSSTSSASAPAITCSTSRAARVSWRGSPLGSQARADASSPAMSARRCSRMRRRARPSSTLRRSSFGRRRG